MVAGADRLGRPGRSRLVERSGRRSGLGGSEAGCTWRGASVCLTFFLFFPSFVFLENRKNILLSFKSKSAAWGVSL